MKPGILVLNWIVRSLGSSPKELAMIEGFQDSRVRGKTQKLQNLKVKLNTRH